MTSVHDEAGSSDDRAPDLQAAIDDLGDGATLLEIPAGTHRLLSSPSGSGWPLFVNRKRNITIRGAGVGATILDMPVKLVASYKNWLTGPLIGYRCEGITVSGITFRLSGAAADADNDHFPRKAVQFLRCDRVHIADCEIDGSAGGGYGLYLFEGHVRVERVWVHDLYRDGINVASVQAATIADCRIERTGDDGVGVGTSLSDPPTTHVTVRDNHFHSCARGIGLYGGSDVTIVGNVFVEPYTNMVLAAPDGRVQRPVERLVVRHNRAERVGLGDGPICPLVNDQSQVIHLRPEHGGEVSGVVIDANVVSGYRNSFVRSSADDVVVSGNRIWGPVAVGGDGGRRVDPGRYPGIWASGGQRISVVGNDIAESAEEGILIEGTSGPVRVTGNRLSALNRLGRSGVDGISVRSDQALVAQNEVDDPDDRLDDPIYMSAPDGAVVPVTGRTTAGKAVAKELRRFSEAASRMMKKRV